MSRFLILLAFLAAFLSRAPANAQMQAHNATGPEFVDVWIPEQNYAKQSARYLVPRSLIAPSRVRIVATFMPNGWTGIENTTHYQWPVAAWYVGYNATLKHVGGPNFAAYSLLYGWSNTTTQDMGMMYDSALVGPNKPFDGVVDWMGESGRSWQIRGGHTITRDVTTNLEAWTLGDAQGLHAFDVTFKPTGGFGGQAPTSHWQGFAQGHTRVAISVTYYYGT